MKSILLHIGSFTIYSYGTVLALGFVLAMIVLLWRGAKRGIDRQTIYDFGIWIILGGLLGARIAYVLFNLAEFKDHPLEILMIQRGGLVFYGSFFGGVFSLWLFVKRKGLSFLKMMDLVMPPLVLGHAIGRIGCFLNGCCFGRPTRCAWAVNFPRASLPAYAFGPLHLIHPVQLYESILLLIVFFILLKLDSYKKFNGVVFCFYLLLYPLVRFSTEFFRGDHPLIIFHTLTLYQGISVLLFLTGIILYLLLRKYDERRNYKTISS